MYSYTYDKKTGGILINSSPTISSKEPRPLYAAELDILGFDKYWKYDKQNELPYMWAEANNYWYRGTLVAKLKGGNLYTAPEIIIPKDDDGNPVTPEPEGNALRTIDIETMVNANREMLEIIEQTTVKKILAIYEKYKNKLDLFYVAFSGGKDSAVLLDLVKKALPKGGFVVVFGDTGMEFPDTYDIVEKTKLKCEEEGIPFYIAKSHLDPKESWKLFGPPSRVLRWCCSVHKSTPQTLKLREITGKSNYVGLAFVGVRAYESATRSKYEYENYGKKQKGQYSHNSILEWTSAEVWLYIYANDISINEAYQKGSARIGCICCPMGGSKASFIEHTNYPKESEVLLSYIKESNARTFITSKDYISRGGWNARKNGHFLTNNKKIYSETTKNGEIIINVISPKTDWKEWIKVLGDLYEKESNYIIDFKSQSFAFICELKKEGYTIRLSERYAKENPLFGKLFRYTFRKAAYCIPCKTCMAICKNGCISFKGKLRIENCNHCFDCYSMETGCLAYHSLNIPNEEGGKMKSLNTFSNHAPKTEWLKDFFEHQSDFLENNTLGRVQKPFYKRFLKDANLVKNNEATAFAKLGAVLTWDTDVFLGFMFINLVTNNPQFAWYIHEMDIGRAYRRIELENSLTASGQSKDNISSIINAFKRLTETPFGTILHFGYITDDGDLVRTKCSISDLRVALYGLFKFAEKCNNYKEFTLATLLNDSIERDGISPTRIFGLERDEMKPILLGLSAKYPEFISSSFTHDLEKISLTEDKTSSDVLNLFREEQTNV
ncbi:phosphoadenosine phosphosulfate reductase family protein [Thermodesulfobium sp. 4217-1]|uniref:phosphoadenosine phosphosulfate reductase domain-containing protein n=1 Tax=Thermodesulfobium sp. 4217-1 TaxID=3120013 RepID=UPI0032216380